MSGKNRIRALLAAATVGLAVGGAIGQIQLPSTSGQKSLELAAMERHPELATARRHLVQARTALSDASHDFGGHRAKALEHVNDALREIELAYQSDRH